MQVTRVSLLLLQEGVCVIEDLGLVSQPLFFFTELASLCAGHTVRPHQYQTLEFGTEKGLLRICTRRWVAPALRTPKLLKAFSKSL